MGPTKTVELIEIRDAVWVVDCGGPTEVRVTWGVHIGETWQIRLNRPYAGGDAVFLSHYFDHLLCIG